MLYPAYVELGTDDDAFGVVLPDFPGCFTAADDEDDLPDKVQEALELYFDGEDIELPAPSKLSDLKQSDQFNYDGVWMMFNVDTSKLSTKSKRVNISLPENLLKQLDAETEKLHQNRSAFLRMLLQQYFQPSPFERGSSGHKHP